MTDPVHENGEPAPPAPPPAQGRPVELVGRGRRSEAAPLSARPWVVPPAHQRPGPDDSADSATDQSRPAPQARAESTPAPGEAPPPAPSQLERRLGPPDQAARRNSVGIQAVPPGLQPNGQAHGPAAQAPRNGIAARPTSPHGANGIRQRPAPPPQNPATGPPQAPRPRPTESGPASGKPSPSVSDFAPERVLKPSRVAPARGWRRAVHKGTFGRLSPSPGGAERREAELVATTRTPIAGGRRRIAILSRKGGIGKTTTTLMLGHTFAHYRGDRVIALDANPDAGSLAYRVRRETDATVTQLLQASAQIHKYSDMRAFTSQALTRLEVLASDDDPTISVALGEPEYRQVLYTLEHHYNLILMDTGTGILDPATQGLLRMCDQIVVCAAPGIDASRASSFTLDWLDQHGYRHLVQEAVVVINQVRKGGLVEINRVAEHFASRCRAVVRVPWDPRLADGAETSFDELRPETREAYLQVAAAAASTFGLPLPPRHS